MGLDTSHGCWNGAYSAFHRWRTRIAEVSGYGSQWLETFTIPDGEDELAICDGRWKKAPDDPILILLLHSDCEGQIPAEYTAALADRLEGLLPNLRGDEGGHIGDIRKTTERFIAGLREAAKENEPVEFA